MFTKLLGKIMKPEVKETVTSEIMKINWVTGTDKDGNHYIKNTTTNEIVYCLTGEKEALHLADCYNKL